MRPVLRTGLETTSSAIRRLMEGYQSSFEKWRVAIGGQECLDQRHSGDKIRCSLQWDKNFSLCAPVKLAELYSMAFFARRRQG